jgi:nucleotide-binding universal stress UspA family protein
MYKTIMVTLDGSEFAEQALPAAVRIACASGAKLEVVRAHSPVAALSPDNDFAAETSIDATIRETETAYLNETVKKLTGIEKLNVTGVLVNSFAADSLQERAKYSKADLVVMATHGRSGLSRFWLGSMAETLVRHLPMPMLLIRPQEKTAPPVKEFAPKRIMIPLDGSALSEEILDPAIEFGKLFGAEFTLLRVVEPFVSTLEFSNQGIIDELTRRYTRYLDLLADRLRDRQVAVDTRVVINQPVGSAIVEEAQARQADLIAISTHGHSGLRRVFLGSVADKVIRASTVPIFIHRAAARASMPNLVG